MKCLAASLLLVVTLLSLGGCFSGPSYLSHSVSDWANQQYAEEPLLVGVATDVIPVIPLVTILATIPDVLILNPIQFWGSDVWTGEGAAFHHRNPKSEKEPFIETFLEDSSYDL